MKRKAVGLAIACFALAHIPAGANRPQRPCLNGLVPALIAASFTGSTDCRQDQLSIRQVGGFRTGKHKFEVYAYRYRLKPAYPMGPRHGGQRIIIMRDGHYLGQYGVVDYATQVSIQGSTLLISPPHDQFKHEPTTIVRLDRSGKEPSPSTVRVDRTGWPNALLVDGEEIGFFK